MASSANNFVPIILAICCIYFAKVDSIPIDGSLEDDNEVGRKSRDFFNEPRHKFPLDLRRSRFYNDLMERDEDDDGDDGDGEEEDFNRFERDASYQDYESGDTRGDIYDDIVDRALNDDISDLGTFLDGADRVAQLRKKFTRDTGVLRESRSRIQRSKDDDDDDDNDDDDDTDDYKKGQKLFKKKMHKKKSHKSKLHMKNSHMKNSHKKKLHKKSHMAEKHGKRKHKMKKPKNMKKMVKEAEAKLKTEVKLEKKVKKLADKAKKAEKYLKKEEKKASKQKDEAKKEAAVAKKIEKAEKKEEDAKKEEEAAKEWEEAKKKEEEEAKQKEEAKKEEAKVDGKIKKQEEYATKKNEKLKKKVGIIADKIKQHIDYSLHPSDRIVSFLANKFKHAKETQGTQVKEEKPKEKTPKTYTISSNQKEKIKIEEKKVEAKATKDSVAKENIKDNKNEKENSTSKESPKSTNSTLESSNSTKPVKKSEGGSESFSVGVNSEDKEALAQKYRRYSRAWYQPSDHDFPLDYLLRKLKRYTRSMDSNSPDAVNKAERQIDKDRKKSKAEKFEKLKQGQKEGERELAKFKKGLKKQNDFILMFNKYPAEEIKWEEPKMLPNCWAQAMLAKTHQFFSPTCNMDGTFGPKQCHLERCWCVKPDGKSVEEVTDLRFKYQLEAMLLKCQEQPPQNATTPG